MGMVANRRLARVISDALWGQFVRILGEKADRCGRTVHTVLRWLASSKICSTCGHRLQVLALQIGHGHARRAGRFTIATTTPPRSFSPPGGRERLNASHISGQDRASGPGGARLRPQPVAAVGAEAGSNTHQRPAARESPPYMAASTSILASSVMTSASFRGL